MRISSLQLVAIRCFEDTGRMKLSPGCNIFVGQNNSGKSTILKGALSLQEGFDFESSDVRKGRPDSFVRAAVTDVQASDGAINRPNGVSSYVIDRVYHGSSPTTSSPVLRITKSQSAFRSSRPNYAIVPFLAKRKASGFEQTVSSSAQEAITGTYQHLVARVDTLATAGPRHKSFVDATDRIVGLPVTTKAAPNGKEAGFYLNDDDFISLERMGDGVTELVAHIVELVQERGKVFILEEPESFLHPRALKSLMSLVREASRHNQFLIATHSNIVLRELADCEGARIFRVSRADGAHDAISTVEVVASTPLAHRDVLRELGYEFADFGLHEAWLFLEESSAESVFRDLLIPWFAPHLLGRLRTFSAAGVGNLEPSISEFTRLVSFIHLQPAYADRLWVRADGDAAGSAVVARLMEKYSFLSGERCATFGKSAFEEYFPERFAAKAAEATAVPDKARRRVAKLALLQEVLDWSRDNPSEAKSEWCASAAEPIALLDVIGRNLR